MRARTGRLDAPGRDHRVTTSTRRRVNAAARGAGTPPRRRSRRRAPRPCRTSSPGSRRRRRSRSSSRRSEARARRRPWRAAVASSRDIGRSPPVSTIVVPRASGCRPRAPVPLVGHPDAGRTQPLDQRRGSRSSANHVVDALRDLRADPLHVVDLLHGRSGERVDRAEGVARAPARRVAPTWRMFSPTSSRQTGRSFDPSIAASRFAIDACPRTRRAARAARRSARRRRPGSFTTPRSSSSIPRLVAEPLDVHRAAAREVEQPLDVLRRTSALVRASAVGLAFVPHERCAARRAGRREPPPPRALLARFDGTRARRPRGSRRRRGARSPCRRSRTSLRATSSSLCNVAVVTVTPPTNTGSSTRERRDLRPSGRCARRSCTSSVGSLLGRELEGDRPPRRVRRGAELVLQRVWSTLITVPSISQSTLCRCSSQSLEVRLDPARCPGAARSSAATGNPAPAAQRRNPRVRVEPNAFRGAERVDPQVQRSRRASPSGPSAGGSPPRRSAGSRTAAARARSAARSASSNAFTGRYISPRTSISSGGSFNCSCRGTFLHGADVRGDVLTGHAVAARRALVTNTPRS